MSTPLLYDKAPPNAEAFVRAWLLPLAGSPSAVGSKRWTAGAVLPYRNVRRITGGDDLISDFPVVRVDTLAATYTEAYREADRTHRRMLILVDDPTTDVVMADGTFTNCQWVETSEGPHEEPYGAESVVTRFVAEYRLGLHFT